MRPAPRYIVRDSAPIALGFSLARTSLYNHTAWPPLSRPMAPVSAFRFDYVPLPASATEMSSSTFGKSPSERATSPHMLGMNPYSSAIPVTRATSGKSSHPTGRASIIQASKGAPFFSHSSGTPARSNEPAAPPESPSKLCECCEEKKSRIWNCSYCDMNFCDTCWARQGPHKPGKTGPDGLPHEKGDPNIVKRLKNILSPPTDIGEQQQLHVDDEDTTWVSTL
jgi:hypothetical protein